MYQYVQKIEIPNKIEYIEERLKELYAKYPHAEFYMEALHENHDNEERRKVKGKVVLSSENNFVLHDNPWKEDDEAYYAHLSFSHVGHWYIPKEYHGKHEKNEFLWIREEEIESVEMRYKPATNKEASGLLERYDD